MSMVDLRNTPLPSSVAGEDGEIDLKDILAQLLARKVFLGLAVIVGATVGAFIGQLPPNQFRASAVVQIEQRADRIPLPSELIGELLTGGTSTNSGLDTEVHIIRSRLVLGPVVDRLNARTRGSAPLLSHINQDW